MRKRVWNFKERSADKTANEAKNLLERQNELIDTQRKFLNNVRKIANEMEELLKKSDNCQDKPKKSLVFDENVNNGGVEKQMVKTLYENWSAIPYDEKERQVNEFLQILKTKLLDPETKEVNICCTKGIQKMYIGKLLADQRYDGRVTYVIKINHNGDL
jgi:negative regulator of replication initiation